MVSFYFKAKKPRYRQELHLSYMETNQNSEFASSKAHQHGERQEETDRRTDRHTCSWSVESLTEFVRRLRGWSRAVVASLTRYADRDFIMLSVTSFLATTTTRQACLSPAGHLLPAFRHLDRATNLTLYR